MADKLLIEQITSVEGAQRVLMGTVVEVKLTSPHGDFRLVYADGREVHIDCGYVGATLYHTATAEQIEAQLSDGVVLHDDGSCEDDPHCTCNTCMAAFTQGGA